MTEDLKAVFTKENTNLGLIPHRLTSVLKLLELDGVDGRQYPLFDSDLQSEESIRATNLFKDHCFID